MKYKILISSVFILLIVLSLLFVPFKTALIFYKENTDKMEAFLPLNKGDTFQIIFTHSIHLTDVVEKYKITDDLNIHQYEFVYEQYGIGMPSNAGEGETFVYEDGKYHIKDMERIFPSIEVRSGKKVPKHRLVWSNKDSDKEHMVWFNNYFEPGAWFTLKVEKISLWEYLKGVKIHE